MHAFRVFMKWCGFIEAVPADLYKKVRVPRVSSEEERRDETRETERARESLEHFATFQCAAIAHAVVALLWETGIRIGTANSLDVGDLEGTEDRLDLSHRLDDGTQSKNGTAGERPIAITDRSAQVLEDYLENARHQRCDEFGREPLLTTSHGRMHRQPSMGSCTG